MQVAAWADPRQDEGDLSGRATALFPAYHHLARSSCLRQRLFCITVSYVRRENQHAVGGSQPVSWSRCVVVQLERLEA